MAIFRIGQKYCSNWNIFQNPAKIGISTNQLGYILQKRQLEKILMFQTKCEGQAKIQPTLEYLKL